jgi:hypothetical protein
MTDKPDDTVHFNLSSLISLCSTESEFATLWARPRETKAWTAANCRVPNECSNYRAIALDLCPEVKRNYDNHCSRRK